MRTCQKVLLAFLAKQVTRLTRFYLKGSKGNSVIWSAAQRDGRFLITQDLDFSDLRKYKPGSHHGIMLVRLNQPSRRALLERVSSVFQSEDVETWTKAFVVVTDRKIRARR